MADPAAGAGSVGCRLCGWSMVGLVMADRSDAHVWSNMCDGLFHVALLVLCGLRWKRYLVADLFRKIAWRRTAFIVVWVAILVASLYCEAVAQEVVIADDMPEDSRFYCRGVAAARAVFI